MNQNQDPTGDEIFLNALESADATETADTADEFAELDGDFEDEEAEESEGEENDAEIAFAPFVEGVNHWERKDDAESPSENKERVSKLLARAGIASRRAAEEIITQGRVSVNGHYVREPGAKADPLRDRIVVDNKPLVISEKDATILLLHKPKYVMTTKDDQGKRTTVVELLPHKYQKLHPVGRLDYETTGVLLLSDDGELTNILTHPSHGVEKVYEARVRGEVTREEIERLQNGIFLDDVKTSPCRVRVVAQREKNALIEITLREGRNRQVRRMLESIGHPVSSLRRIKFGTVELEGLEPGSFRELLPGEVKMLRKHAEATAKEKRAKAPRKTKSGGKPTPKPNSRPKKEETRETSSRGDGPGNWERSSDARNAAPRGGDARGADARGAETRSAAPRGAAPRSTDKKVIIPRNPDNRRVAPRNSDSRHAPVRDSVAPKKPEKRGSGPRKLDSRGAAPRKEDVRGPASRNTDTRGALPRSPAPRSAAANNDWPRNDDSKKPRTGTGKPAPSNAAKPPRTPAKPRTEGAAPAPRPRREAAPREERTSRDDTPRNEQSPLAKRIEKKWR